MQIQEQGISKSISWGTVFSKHASLILILGLAIILRFYQIGAESLWEDEIRSVQKTLDGGGLPPANLLRPAYYVCLRVWMFFGMSDAWLRSLSVLFGVGSVYLTYLLGDRLSSRATGLVAALLLALSPLAIEQSQEVRMYALGQFSGLIGTVLLASVFESYQTSSLRWWTIARLITCWTAPLNSALLMPDTLLATLRLRRQPGTLAAYFIWLIILCGVWTLSFIRLVEATPSYMSGFVEKMSRPTPISFLGILRIFTTYSSPAPGEVVSVWSERFADAFVLVLAGVLVVALWNRSRLGRLSWALSWGYLPLVAVFAASYITKSIWLGRYLSFTAPYILILLAAGFVYLWQRWRMAAVGLIVVYTIAITAGLHHYYTTENRADWRSASQIISINETPQDAIYLFPASDQQGLEYYYKGSLPIIGTFLRHEQPDAVKLTSDLNRLAATHLNLWLVLLYSQSETGKQWQQTFQQVIEQQFHTEMYEPVGGGLELYQIQACSAASPNCKLKSQKS
jgi:hypothetical protein